MPPQSLIFRTILPLHETRFSPPRSSSNRLSSPFPHQSRNKTTLTKPPKTQPPLAPDLRRLTARIVDLTRRRQLNQIFAELEAARKRYRRLNTIVMNAVMEACVHCGDVNSALRIFKEMGEMSGCGVDCISYGILLKGLGQARRVDEAFQVLESIQDGTALGNPILSPRLVYGFLNAILESGDMRRANALVARCRHVLYGKGESIILYNLLMKGYVNTNFPMGALTVRDEMVRQGLKPDRLSYNTLIAACVQSGDMDKATSLLADMKVSMQ